MGLPILNMDGYLLKQIKAETARANAADANLQNQITALSQGAIVGATANTLNGWRMIDADELIYWTGSSDVSSYPVLSTTAYDGVIKSGGWTIYKSSNVEGFSLPMPWSETAFNKGKPYLAVIGFQYATEVSGDFFKAGVNIGYQNRDNSFLPEYHHEQRIITFPRVSRCDVIAFSPPFLVDKANVGCPYGVNIFVEQFKADAAGDLTVHCINPYDLSLDTENGTGLNLYVNFAKEE